MRPVLAFDMEVYVNYTLVLFKFIETGEVIYFENHLPDETDGGFDPFTIDLIKGLVKTHRVVGFNSKGYDIPILFLLFKGATSGRLKYASDRIIQGDLKPWNFEKEFDVKLDDPLLDHVDVMDVAPLVGSLKVYGGRLNSYSIQGLPIDPASRIATHQLPEMRRYCENDTKILIDLYEALRIPLELREEMSQEFGIDLRSKSDAQVAEAIIKRGVESILHKKLDKPPVIPDYQFRYQIPSWMAFQGLDILDSIRDAKFMLSNKGAVVMPKELSDREIVIGNGVYRMGIGGLHSSEKKQVVRADDTHVILDFDVASYYPAILLNQGLYPKHIGPAFLSVYKGLVAKRLAAKKAGQKRISESLKISINGTFGKTGSKWSVLFSPELMIQTTVTGQLALLMLIEMLADVIGVEVVSANTDGVTIRCEKSAEADAVNVVKTWELITEFEIERADYSLLASRDVNGYIAVKTNGELKTKGPYGRGLPLHGNPHGYICADAVAAYLTKGTPIETTIKACTDLREFLFLRNVTGGATHHGVEIGKVIRWYYSLFEVDSIYYKVNGHLVPKTLGAAPVITMPETFPSDMDFDWYIQEANEMLADMGVTA